MQVTINQEDKHTDSIANTSHNLASEDISHAKLQLHADED